MDCQFNSLFFIVVIIVAFAALIGLASVMVIQLSKIATLVSIISTKPLSKEEESSKLSVWLETSTKQLEFINYTVLSLLQIRIADARMSNTPLKLKDVDVEVKALSFEVKKSLSDDFFNNKYSLYDKDFLMKYIFSKCKAAIVEVIMAETTN